MTSANKYQSGFESFKAQKFTSESDFNWQDNLSTYDDENDTQFAMEDITVLSRNTQRPLPALIADARGLTNHSTYSKPSSDLKSKANIWEDSFWKRPGSTKECPLSPPLSPGAMDFYSSPKSAENLPLSPTAPGFDASQGPHRRFSLAKRSSAEVNLCNIPRPSAQLHNIHPTTLSSLEHPTTTTPDLSAVTFEIPPAPKDDSVAEPPFITRLRRSSSIVSTTDAAAVSNRNRSGSPPRCVPTIIRKGRFEIVLGERHGLALNPRELL